MSAAEARLADQRPQPFLRVPPFPGSKVARFELDANSPVAAEDPAELDRCIALLKEHRVGGTYWGPQPALPQSYVLLRSVGGAETVSSIADQHAPSVLWLPDGAALDGSILVVTGECDPWHMLSRAVALVAEPQDQVAVIASILGIPTYVIERSPATITLDRRGTPERLQGLLPALLDPFDGGPLSLPRAIGLCAFWRRLVDSNRDLAGGLGFAFWKQSTVAPLLWAGAADIPFYRSVPQRSGGAALALWRAKAPPEAIKEAERRGLALVEVEDGFLRSSGLGADCVPPLSITVDRLGAHFDPAQPSELELLIEQGPLDDPDLLERARSLRRTIVAEGLGKYERATSRLPRPGGDRRHVLVPGQVEDDQSVRTGGCGLTSNLELLKRVREREPDSYILYKPHPDVVAGHRAGHVPEAAGLAHADTIVADAPISALLDMVDAVHVNTSLAGFEALLRDKEVTTHGVPFYAGWGRTVDLGPVPSRRRARRTVDELVAATLLLYPRYLDPVSGLPCPAETVVRRLCTGQEPKEGLLPAIRRMQGRLKRSVRVFVR